MAAAYHQEALRKQRVVNRAHEARLKMERETQLAREMMVASNAASTHQQSPHLRPVAPTPNYKYRTRRQRDNQEGEAEEEEEERVCTPCAHGDHSRCRSVTNSRESTGSRGSQGGPRHTPTTRSQSGSRSGSRITSPKPREAHTPVDFLSEVERTERDLYKKSLALRDNNLTMGHIDPHDVVLDQLY